MGTKGLVKLVEALHAARVETGPAGSRDYLRAVEMRATIPQGIDRRVSQRDLLAEFGLDFQTERELAAVACALQVVPSAVLSGVYKLRNLKEAQDRGLALFWAHDLTRLTDWIKATAT